MLVKNVATLWLNHHSVSLGSLRFSIRHLRVAANEPRHLVIFEIQRQQDVSEHMIG